MIDTTSLFLHVLAAVGILGGAVCQLLAGRRLRAANTVAEIVLWARFTNTLGRLIAMSAVVSFLTGGHLAGAVWTTERTSGFERPFITLGGAALVLLVPVGPIIGGRLLRNLIITAQQHPSPGPQVPDDVRQAARSPSLWGPVHALAGVAGALVAVMVYKPGWAVSAALLVAAFTGAWATGVAVARLRPPPDVT